MTYLNWSECGTNDKLWSGTDERRSFGRLFSMLEYSWYAICLGEQSSVDNGETKTSTKSALIFRFKFHLYSFPLATECTIEKDPSSRDDKFPHEIAKLKKDWEKKAKWTFRRENCIRKSLFFRWFEYRFCTNMHRFQRSQLNHATTR